MAHPSILKCTVGGQPVKWIDHETAISMYAKDLVAWEAGETSLRFHGGLCRATGNRSFLDVNSIIAVRGEQGSRRLNRVPPVTRYGVIARDGFLCMYCGAPGTASTLTMDHVQPTSTGGRHAWTNLLSACKRCNSHKGAREPHEAGMTPIAIPYAPNRAEHLLLMGRRVIADQQAFLLACAGKNSPLHQRYQ